MKKIAINTKAKRNGKQIRESIADIKLITYLIEKDIDRDIFAHRKIHINNINANAILAHVVTAIENAGIDIKSLPACNLIG